MLVTFFDWPHKDHTRDNMVGKLNHKCMENRTKKPQRHCTSGIRNGTRYELNTSQSHDEERRVVVVLSG